MNVFIEDFIVNKIRAKVITVNGYQIVCSIIAQGENYIIIKAGNEKKLIYKHAISTIENA